MRRATSDMRARRADYATAPADERADRRERPRPRRLPKPQPQGKDKPAPAPARPKE